MKNIVITPENFQRFEECLQLLHQCSDNLRLLSSQFINPIVKEEGLLTMIKKFTDECNQSGALQVTYQASGLEEDSIIQPESTSILQLVTDIVENARHRGAKRVTIHMEMRQRHLHFSVKDDSDFTIESRDGIGNTIQIHLPLK